MNSSQNMPLLSKFDLDPGAWRPYFYPVEITVGETSGDRGTGSIYLNNQPFILTRITHQIVGDTAHSSTSDLFQDGMYSIYWRDDQSVYTNAPIMANSAFGSVASGFSYELPYPIPYAGSKTISFEVTNRVTRDLEADEFVVAILLHGVAFWGELSPPPGTPQLRQR